MAEVVAEVSERRLLPEVRRQLDMEGTVSPARGVGHESTAVATVDLAFWKLGSSLGRIEIPVDILRIECAEPTASSTAPPPTPTCWKRKSWPSSRGRTSSIAT